MFEDAIPHRSCIFEPPPLHPAREFVGGAQRISVDELTNNMRVRLAAGEQIPVDGIIGRG